MPCHFVGCISISIDLDSFIWLFNKVGSWIAEVTLEKNKLTTLAKANDLDHQTEVVATAITSCVNLLQESNDWPMKDGVALDIGAIDESHFSMGHDVLSSSTELTMMLRACIANKLFVCQYPEADKLTKLVVCDPYLSGLEELASQSQSEWPNLLQSVHEVLLSRSEWNLIKTVSA